MKCKKHPIDLSSNAGVCASCLRERLVAIIAAQVQAQREALFQQGHRDRRNSDAQQPPFLFPRSVSPYISHRKSDSAATWQIHGNHRRFYSTPHVGPNGFTTVAAEKGKKSNKGRFSSFLIGIFRLKSVKTGLDTGPVTDRGSWFSMIVPGRREKQIRTFSVDDYSFEAQGKPSRIPDRGMSPARSSNLEDGGDGSSGYSSESSRGWKQTPKRTPAAGRCDGRTAAHSRSVSGLAFCLSPLVRPIPNPKRSQKVAPPEMLVVAGEVRAPPKPHLSNAPSFCRNRSRKLAGLGKQSYNPYPSH